jgi:uncharacterized protein YjbI with pentapeptide repeats
MVVFAASRSIVSLSEKRRRLARIAPARYTWGVMFAVLLAAIMATPLHLCMECSFAGSQLAKADFSDVVYVGANFAGATLRGASFRGAKLVAANFQGADLQNADFDDVECTACNFQGAKFDGATFSAARIVAANFLGFSGNLADAALRDLLAGCFVCNFRTASLAGRDLSGVSLIGVDLSQADLRGTKFNGAVLCWYVIDGAQRQTKCDSMQGARVGGASFLGVLLCADPTEARSCVAVTADSLRRYSGSALDGATLPEVP